MRRVIIESPFAGEVDRNREYLRRLILDSLERGESPYASHGFFTHFLDDTKPEERKLGINAGLEWAKAAEAVIYCLDLGLSSGMLYALERHSQASRRIEIRYLSGEATVKFAYTNHAGITDVRRAIFKEFLWGRTDWHPKDQTLMRAHCLDRNEERLFSVRDMLFLPSRAGRELETWKPPSSYRRPDLVENSPTGKIRKTKDRELKIWRTLRRQ